MNKPPLEILNRYPELRAGTLHSCAGQSGLSGARIWKVQFENSERAYVLRCWPAGHPTFGQLTWIHQVVRHAFASGCHFLSVPVPNAQGQTITLVNDRPPHVEQNAEADLSRNLQEMWEVSPWMPGQADFNLNPNVARLRQMLQALARFHQASAQVTLDFHTSQNLQRRTGLLQQLSSSSSESMRELNKATCERVGTNERLVQGGPVDLIVSSEFESSQMLKELQRLFLEFAPRLMPRLLKGPLVPTAPANQEPSTLKIAGLGNPGLGNPQSLAWGSVVLPVQPILRDIWHDHVLFLGDEVTGLIDYGAMQVDNVSFDIARLLGTTAADDSAMWEQGLAAYCELRPLSEVERWLIPWIDQTGVLLGCYHWLRWLTIEGRKFDNPKLVQQRITFLAGRLRRLIDQSLSP